MYQKSCHFRYTGNEINTPLCPLLTLIVLTEDPLKAYHLYYFNVIIIPGRRLAASNTFFKALY